MMYEYFNAYLFSVYVLPQAMNHFVPLTAYDIFYCSYHCHYNFFYYLSSTKYLPLYYIALTDSASCTMPAAAFLYCDDLTFFYSMNEYLNLYKGFFILAIGETGGANDPVRRLSICGGCLESPYPHLFAFDFHGVQIYCHFKMHELAHTFKSGIGGPLTRFYIFEKGLMPLDTFGLFDPDHPQRRIYYLGNLKEFRYFNGGYQTDTQLLVAAAAKHYFNTVLFYFVFLENVHIIPRTLTAYAPYFEAMTDHIFREGRDLIETTIDGFCGIMVGLYAIVMYFVIRNLMSTGTGIKFYFITYIYEPLIKPFLRGWRVSEVVNEIYNKNFSFIRYMVRLVLFSLRHEKVKGGVKKHGENKPLRAGTHYFTSRNILLWNGVLLIPVQMYTIDRGQYGNITVAYIWRFLYGILIAIFLFFIKGMTRILFIYFYALRVVNFFLFYSLYHVFGIKLYMNEHLYTNIFKIFVTIQNLLTVYLVMDAHVAIARDLFFGLPNFFSALNSETYLTIPSAYPTKLSYLLRYLMPVNSFQNHLHNFEIYFSKGLFLLFLNFILIIPISYFFNFINKLFMNGKNIEIGMLVYYYIYKIYVKIIKNFLFLEISVTFFNVLRFCFISIISIFLIFYKYILLFIIFLLVLHFFIFLFFNMLKLHVSSIVQSSVHVFFIFLGGFVIYSGEFFKFFIMSCLHIILFILFRLRYILFIIIFLYFGINTHVIGYFVYRWATAFPLEVLYSGGRHYVDMHMPISIGSWIPNGIGVHTYSAHIIQNLHYMETAVWDGSYDNPGGYIGQHVFLKYNMVFGKINFGKTIYDLCPIFFDSMGNTSMCEVFIYLIETLCRGHVTASFFLGYDCAGLFIKNYGVGYFYPLVGIFFGLKFQILFTLPFIFRVNGGYLMPELCSIVTIPMYYRFLAPVGLVLNHILPDICFIIFAYFLNGMNFISYFGYLHSFNVLINTYYAISSLEGCNMFMKGYYYFYLLFSISYIYYFYLGLCCDLIYDVCCYFIPNFFFPIVYWPSKFCLFKILGVINVTLQSYIDLFFSYARLLFSDLVTNLGTDTTRGMPMGKNRSFRRVTRIPLILGRLYGAVSYNEAVLGGGQFPMLMGVKYLRFLEYECVHFTMGFFISIKKFFIIFFFCSGYFFGGGWVTLIHLLCYNKSEDLSGYNSHYLGFLFRKNSQKTFMSGIETNDTIEAFDYFIDKFFHINSVLPKHLAITERARDERIAQGLEMRKEGVVEITVDAIQKLFDKRAAIRNYRLDFNNDIIEIKNLTKESRKTVRDELKLKTRTFLSDKVNLINSLREEFGFEQTNEPIVEDFGRAIDFDYNTFFLDSKYSAFYHVRGNEYSTLSVFLTRGFRRDKYIRQILLNESSYEILPLDLALEEFNQGTFEVSDRLFGFLENFMLQFNFAFPRFYGFKESGMGFFTKSKDAILGQDMFVIDEDIDVFDFYFIYSFCIPCYLLIVMIRLNFGLKEGLELSPTMHDVYIWFKLFFGNQFSAGNRTIYEYYIGYAIYISFENIPSSESHEGFGELYPYGQGAKFDPLGKYGAIQAEHVRILFDLDDSLPTRELGNFGMLFDNYFCVLQDCFYKPLSQKYRIFNFLHCILGVLLFIYFFTLHCLTLAKISKLDYLGMNIDEGILVHVKRYYQIASIKGKSYFNGINNKT